VGCAWGDYDNDGDLDLYLPQIYDIDYAYSFLYENNGDGTFTDVTLEGQVRVWDTYAGCWADYDNDGDLDLITSGRDSGGNADPHFIHLYRNDGPQGSWIHINLKGDGVYSNRAAIGARVIITTQDGFKQVKEVEGGGGPHGHQNSLILEFGFGLYSGPVDIEIRWPQNKIQFIKNVSLNQKLSIVDESAGDLLILGMDYNIENPIMGETITLTSTVENAGSTVINSADVKYYMDVISDSNQIPPSQTLINILPGEQRVTTVDWDTSGISGSHTIYAKAEITDPPPITTSNILSNMIYIRFENALPVAVLSANLTSINKGESVLFDASNSTDDTTIIQYYFDFGDGQTSGWISQSTISHIYTTGGDYNATLKVKDDDNGISVNSAQEEIEVKAKPYANIVANPTEIFKGDSVYFSGDASFDEGGTVEEYFFDFGDGEDSGWISSSKINHTYPLYGDYNATLLVKDDDGQISENPSKTFIKVQTKPIALLSAIPQLIYKDEIVNFDATGSSDEDGIIEEYYFDFGDGQNSNWITDPQITHVYSNTGHYMANLIVRDNDLIESENSQEIEIEVRAYPVSFLQANITIVHKMDTVLFDGSWSSDEGGFITQYNFDFGDGETTGWIAQSQITHVYTSSGTYNASLIVRDDDTDVSLNIAQVSIEVRARPNAVLALSDTSIFKGEEITFNASNSNDEGGYIEAYFFDFGNGEFSGWIFSSQITHLYNQVGEFTVSLKVRDNDLEESLNIEDYTILISAKPHANLFIDSTIIHEDESVILNGSQSSDEDGDVKEYYFDYGDGQFSGWTNEPEITHLYSSFGTYNITLIVRDNDDFISDNAALKVIEVRSIPKAILQVNVSTVDEGESVTFSGTKSKDKDGTVDRYFFDFGNGETSGWISQDETSHVYLEAGTYLAILSVMDNHDDLSTNFAQAKVEVEVPNKKPTSYIDEVSHSIVTLGKEVLFRGHGEDEDGQIFSYLWSSSKDGELSNADMVLINSLSVGKHTIAFKVRDNEGLWSDEVFEVVTVKATNEKPELEITYPEDNTRILGILTITGSADDADGSITQILVSIDGRSWQEIDANDLWSYEIDASAFSQGEHVIAFRAYDGEDYSEEKYLTVLVGEKEGEDMELLTIFGLIIMVIIAVLLLAYIIGRRAKKNPAILQPQPAQPRTFRPIPEKKETSQTRISW
jgi:hypothetical protein